MMVFAFHSHLTMISTLLAISILLLLSARPSIFCHAIVVDTSNCTTEPWGRYSMTGDWNVDGTVFYSFSGDTSSASDGLGGVVRTNWKYNLTTDCWSQISTPTSDDDDDDDDVAVGYRATAVRLMEDGIVVFGGADSGYRAVNHIWRFDEATEQLEDITARYDGSSRPSARFKHAAIAILDGKTMLVTGGRRGGDVLPDVWTFSFASGWERMSDDGFAGGALYRHSMAWDPDTQTVWAFGGLDGFFQRNGELWRANANDLASGFSKVNATSWQITPPKSASLGMTYYGGRIYVWGGTCSNDSTLFMYTVATNTWCKVPVKENSDGYSKPSRRDAFMWLPRFTQGETSSGSFISPSNQTERKLEIFVAGGDVICVYGGQSAYTVMDVWQLSIEDDSMEWTLLYRPYNARNLAHASAICSDTERNNCRAGTSIEEDLAATTRPSGEDGMEGQCAVLSGANDGNGKNSTVAVGGSSATSDGESLGEETSAAHYDQFRVVIIIATMAIVLLDSILVT